MIQGSDSVQTLIIVKKINNEVAETSMAFCNIDIENSSYISKLERVNSSITQSGF